MQRQLNIVRATEASPAAEPGLSQLLEQAAAKARAARNLADGIENIEEASIADFVAISNLCSTALRLIGEAKALANNDDPQPPATAAAAPVSSPMPLAA